MRFIAALLLCLIAFSTPAHARLDLSREFSGDRYSGGSPAAAPQRYVVKKVKRAHRAIKRTIRNYARHISRSNANITDLVPPLASKVAEINRICGSRLVSGYRPGSRVRGSGRLSLHSAYPSRAADLAGNPDCIRRLAQGWPGGMSTDYGNVKHYHISYEPGGREWGARFAHYGKRRAKRYRYAHAR